MDLRKGVSENRYALFVVIKSIVGRYFNVYYIVHPHIKIILFLKKQSNLQSL